MNATRERARLGTWLLWPCVAASLALVAMGAGALAPLAPLLAFALFVVIVIAPLRWSAVTLFAVALLADNPGERPMDGLWESPLMPVGRLLYENLNKLTHIDALRISLLEVAIATLMIVTVVRKLRADRIDEPGAGAPVPNPMRGSYALMLAAIVGLEVWGLARHGDFKNSLWQFRQLMWMPVLGVLFGTAFKTARSRDQLVRITLVVACVRAAFGLFFHYAIAVPRGLDAAYATTHSDSILATIAILLGLVLVVVRPCVEHTVLNLVCQPLLVLGMLVNDRRIAFVGIAGGLVALVLLSPAAVQRKVTRSLLAIAPVFLLYAAVGWNAHSPLFKPITKLRSVIEQKDDSSKTRDIENFNLIQTLKRQPVFGSGFGHEYIEVVQANRVDQIFAQYRFIAHNSVLWLLSLAGVTLDAIAASRLGYPQSNGTEPLRAAIAALYPGAVPVPVRKEEE